MKQLIKKLPELELDIMLIIWESKEPVTRGYITDHLRNHKELAITTILTILTRLTQKGYLQCEKQGKSNSYTPLISKEEYISQESRTFLQKLYGNSVKNFVANLYNSDSIDDNDLEELEAFLDQAKEERDGR